MTTLPSCPVCNRTTNKPLFPVGQGQLVRCQHCRVVFYAPQPTPEELIAFYDSKTYRERYQAGPMGDADFSVGRYQELIRILRGRDPDSTDQTPRRLLDIGCGHGGLLEVAMKAGWQVAGTEISPLAAAQAPSSVRQHIHVGELQAIDLKPGSFDLITMYHIIEHFLDPVAVLKKVGAFLRPDGILFVETPNLSGLGARIRGKRWSHIIPPEHLLYFNPDALEFTLRAAGFNRVETFSGSPQTLEAAANFPAPLRAAVRFLYSLAPRLGLGAALQAVASRNSTEKN